MGTKQCTGGKRLINAEICKEIKRSVATCTDFFEEFHALKWRISTICLMNSWQGTISIGAGLLAKPVGLACRTKGELAEKRRMQITGGEYFQGTSLYSWLVAPRLRASRTVCRPYGQVKAGQNGLWYVHVDRPLGSLGRGLDGKALVGLPHETSEIVQSQFCGERQELSESRW
jgi:hypothetical protein